MVFTGYRADAARVLAGCDMFVLGSSWEGLPVALMEALALNLPVVATSVGGMAQVLTNQQDALLVPPRNAPALARAIEQIVSDPGLRRRIARGGQRLSNTFDVRRVTDELEAIYAGLVDPTPRLDAVPGKQAATTSHPQRSHPQRNRSQRSHPQRNRSQRDESVEIRPAQPDDQDRIERLFEQTLDWGDDPRNQAFFEWKHQLNPRGPSPSWVAIANDEIVGVRTFLQWQFRRGDQQLSAARAVDTAIDPRYRRRGIFRELTMHGVDELTDSGVDFIFNTPNKFSRPGYLSLGWREVGRLPLALRPRVILSPSLATALVPAQRWSDQCEIGVAVSAWLDNGGFQRAPSDAECDERSLSTVTDEAFIRWRYGHHLVPYRVVEDGRATIIVRTRRRGRARELVMAHAFGDPHDTDRLSIEALHETRSSYALRLGPAHLRRGIVSLPNGPRLLWRELHAVGMPPLANWRLSLGDVELM